MINIVIHDDLLPYGLKGEDIAEAIEIRQLPDKQQAKYDALVAELRHIIAWGQSVNPDVLSEHQRSYRKGKVTAALDALVAAGELSPDDLPIVEGVTEKAT